jgi:acetyl-CoA carboxylase carboxyltransferase component
MDQTKTMNPTRTITAPLAAVVASLQVKSGDQVNPDTEIATLESMKMQTTIHAQATGIVRSVQVQQGETIQANTIICEIEVTQAHAAAQIKVGTPTNSDALSKFQHRQALTLDKQRHVAISKRHAKGFRSARENLADLVDADSFVEYGQFAIAAQRERRPLTELLTETAADGIITGLATINAQHFDEATSKTAVIVNDYSVLAGTQGYFHHKKLDRILELAEKNKLPVVMYTEGGGGRPGDTDVKTSIGGLNITSFSAWAALSGVVPLIAVNNGYCFAGNAALFGCADITIATEASYIGMAGPAMIEGGGLGSFKPTDIGPTSIQKTNGVIDIVAQDEAHATQLAQQVLGYFQGDIEHWQCADQTLLNTAMPADRRFTYDIYKVITTLVDTDSFLELQPNYGQGIITGFARIEGKVIALICNQCKVLGGAIDGEAAIKTAKFLNLCESFSMAVVALGDTPGFMVGPDSENSGSVRQMSELFIAGAKLSTPLVSIFLRKGYGLGAMAMAGGSFMRPSITAAWPTGEFGAMGLEGGVRLGFKKELEAITDEQERELKFNELVALGYDMGKATEAAAYLELDAVIEPADTRKVILQVLTATN